jgi:hypothetical protein
MPTQVRDIVLVADCAVNIGQGVVVENALLVNTVRSDTSFFSDAGFQPGRNDGCADGGSAQIVPLGGVSVASDLQVYGSQILTLVPNRFAARTDGIEGASNMNLSCCGTGMNNFEADHFLMVN